ncbi:MAG: UDP-N-acetylglucosamine 4,6-dehydratase (inverting) [Desulfuromonadaceae bacterium]|nr:UDP-N-acetylglucosamine 4,6-dehydratase (inverting) [Desulfuromonadaceae bacterium]
MDGKSILITGGTGSFGQKFVETLFKNYPAVERVVIFSRDELKQFEMAQRFSTRNYAQIRYFLGDVRDKDRIKRALEGIDVVIHAAALKQVPAAEYNPFEVIKTNVLGAQNVIDACFDLNIKKVIALSTDKAAAPINLYGATKLCSDKLFVAANNMKGKRDLRLSVVRYGNVLGSRGSVIPYFLKKKRTGAPIPITDPRMTRFSITLDEGVAFVMKTLEVMVGGEIFVPKIPSVRIVDIAEAIDPGGERELIGIRPGEKINEEMITETDGPNSIEFEDYYTILPSMNFLDTKELMRRHNGRMCPEGFKYHSGNNDHWLTVEQIRCLVDAYVGEYGA